MTLEELQLLITAETSQLKKDLDGVKRQVQSTEKEVKRSTGAMSAAFKRLAAVVASVIAAISFTSAIKDAMQFEAALGQINRLLGANASAFQSWADTQGKALGFARSEVIRFGAVYANLLSGFSRDTGELTQRTQDLLQASAVVASSTGRTMEDVMERIRSGLLGNTEAIEDLGINVNIALIESTKAFREFANGRSWQQLDFNTQQTIRYFAILEQAATKYGNELAQNTATRQAIFNAHLKDARLYLGQAFLPIYNAVLPALTAMAQALATATRWLAAFVSALFGTKSTTQQQTNAITSQAGAVSEMGDAYEKAGKQAKGAIGGFDQINLVGGTPSGGGGSSGGAGGGAAAVGGAMEGMETGVLSGVSESMDKVAASAQRIADKVKTMASSFKSAFGTLAKFVKENSDIIIAALAGVGAAIATYLMITRWPAIAAAISTAITTIRTAFTALAVALGAISWVAVAIAAAIGGLVAAFVYFYRTNETFRDTVHTILEKIGEVAVWLWNEVLVPFGIWLGSVLVAAWHAVAEGAKWLWENVLVPFGKWLADVMPKAWDAVVTAAEWLWKNVLVPFGEYLKWLWDNVLVPVGKIIGEVLAIAFETVSEVAKDFWEKVLVPLGKALSEMLEPAIEAVTAVLTWLWEKAFVPFGKFIKTNWMPLIEALIDIFEWLWKNVLKPLVNFISNVVVVVFRNAFDSIGGIIGGVKNIFIGLMNFITGIFTGDWEKAWEGVKKIFKGVFDSLWNIVKFPLNLIIDGINAMIDGLNKLKIDVPKWVGKIPGVPDDISSFGFNIPRIPKLAVGTNYVAEDGLAFLHEGEAVVPKKYNPAAGGALDNREVVSVLKSILQAVQAGSNVEVNISQSEIGGAAVNYIRSEQRRTGRVPFTV